MIAVLGAGAFFAYKMLVKKNDAAQSKATPPAQPKPPEPPPPPPVESQKLATEQQEPVELKASVAGQLETIVANDTAVKAGDPVALLAGHKPLETEIAAMQKDIDTRVKPELDKAQKDRDAAQTAGNKAALTAAEARVADRTKSLDEKQAKLDARKAELAKLQIKAPGDGKVTAVGKANTHVGANDVVAKLARGPVLTATFKTASGVTPQTRVLLAPKASEQKLSCTVVTADASGVKVACPGDAVPDGTEVTFVGPDPSAVPPPAGSNAEIDMNDEGSAAAGSAAAGSAAGSAKAEPVPPPPAPRPVAPKAPPHVAPKAPAHVAPKAPPHPVRRRLRTSLPTSPRTSPPTSPRTSLRTSLPTSPRPRRLPRPHRPRRRPGPTR